MTRYNRLGVLTAASLFALSVTAGAAIAAGDPEPRGPTPSPSSNQPKSKDTSTKKKKKKTTGMLPVRAGQHVRARFGSEASVEIVFAA